MSSQTFRLFINNVTENIDEECLKEKLSQFGNVTSIEIKQRKNIIGNQTPTFAYINIDTSHENLQKCFKNFSTEKFKNIYIDISVAKESFMERLKREREQNQKVESQNHVNLTNAVITDEKCKSECLNEAAIKDSSSKEKAIINSEVNFLKKSERSVSISEQKRLQSIAEKRREFNSQKHVLKEALSRIDSKPKSKIIFDSEELHSNFHENDKSKVSSDFQLFDDGEDDEININFDVKELNKDARGQKLINLERTFKNDKRFKIDSRFSGNNFSDEDLNDDKNLDDNGIIDGNTEKEEQMKILEQVIGRNLDSSNYYAQAKPSSNKSVSGMVRYDPDHKDHHKYEIVASVDKTVETKKGRKRKASVNELDIDKKLKKPQVSQEKFYNITDNLRETLQTEQQFSLLQTFGDHHHHQNDPDENYHVTKITKSHLLTNNTNPFKYDSSSDSEGEIIEKNDEQKIGETNLQINNNNQNKLRNQSFFFKDDDYRLQEGLDFVKRLDTEEHTDFLKLRRDIKEVAKAKVRNNLRKKRQFKTKLGGKKRIKIKRALKR